MAFVKQSRHKVSRSGRLSVSGEGIVNSLINKLPFEAHLPGGYQYCGPGTKLQKRLARGDPGINPLDVACKQHDIAYENNDLTARHTADYELEQRAWNRVKSRDASAGEKGAAWLVTNIMKVKRKLGMGCDRQLPTSSSSRSTHTFQRKKRLRKIKQQVSFGAGIVNNVRRALRKAGGKRLIEKNVGKAAKIALHAARQCLRNSGGRRKIRTPRIIPIPKVGGILPLLPILAGLSALGTLAGGAAGVAKVVHDVRAGKNQLAEAQRHNKHMEAIALGKSGNGLYMKPYRKGLGLYINQQQQQRYSSKNY